ncbi:MAG TPA: 3-keto-5-aminohexanoate cleavage protein [Xanthobacteraceae bacterium]|nr:3-keto-5-aminohexanoate cleavage protein [Xanthobacteraceae bacterium]
MKRILTCAVTGASPSIGKHPAIPITPQQIAEAAIGAARAGAAVAHIHVRDPDTGAPSMELELYREAVNRIRDGGVDILINLTTGPGGRFVPGQDDPNVPGPGSHLCTPIVRVRHVLELKPDIWSLDFATMWFGDSAFVNAPPILGEMARLISQAGVLPELEVFDTGDIHLARHFLDTGVLASPGFFQIVLGVRYGAAAIPESMLYMRNLLPPGSRWSAFGTSSQQFPMLAQSLLLGGNLRVGLEDTLYLEKGVLAPDNAALVEKGVKIMRSLGFEPATPSEARAMLGIRGAPAAASAATAA